MREKGKSVGTTLIGGPSSVSTDGRPDPICEGRKEGRAAASGNKTNAFIMSSFAIQLVNGSRVGQVGPVDSCGQV